MPSLYEMVNGTAQQPATDLTNRLYAGYLGRAPDPAGQKFFDNALKNGTDPRAIEQMFYTSDEARKSGPNFNIPRAASQDEWIARAQKERANLNANPFVLAPGMLTGDQRTNQNTIFPAIMQQGGVSPVYAGGKNIAPDLTKAGADTSAMPQFRNIDDMAGYLSKLTGKSLDESKTLIQTAMGSMGSTATDPTSAIKDKAVEQVQRPYMGPSDY